MSKIRGAGKGYDLGSVFYLLCFSYMGSIRSIVLHAFYRRDLQAIGGDGRKSRAGTPGLV